MKKIHYILFLFASVLLMLSTLCCKKDYTKDSPFENVVYIDAAQVKELSQFTFNNVTETGSRSLSAVMAYPNAGDVEVKIEVAPSLVSLYNARLGGDYSLLDPKHYSLAESSLHIPAGKSRSRSTSLDFTALTELELDKGYLLPVTITAVSGGVGILEGSRTVCYVVRRSSAITSAVSLKNNYFEVRGFDGPDEKAGTPGSPTAGVVNDMKQLTYEAIVRVNDFGDDKKDISTIMGIEQYCLFRFGDANFPQQQLQFAVHEIKFPAADKSKLLQAGEWYHLAITHDTETRTAAIYVDGQLYSSIDNYGKAEDINLGKQVYGKDFMFKIGHSYGEPDDMSRMLDGEICEVRIWRTVRTQEEIYRNMYDVDPTTPGLCAYWKFNEGAGATVKDWTGNGNDATAHYPDKVVWPSGIEVPVKNKD